MHVLAIDVGTSSVKAAVLDQATGEPAAPPAKVACPVEYPGGDGAELDAGKLWAAVSEAAAKAVAAGGPRAEGVGLTGMTPALVLLDAADRVLAPIRIHSDRRSRPVARKVWAEVGEEFLATAGNRPLPGGISAVSYAQLVIERPDLSEQVRSYLHANGWIGLRLTGERRFDPANASFTGLFGTVTDRQWTRRWCDYFGVDPAWLPPVVDGRATLGGLRPEVAADWGLDAGIPVKLGTADTSSAMLAAGLGHDELLHSVGTTQVLACLTETPEPDPRRLTRLFGVGDASVYVAHNPVGGEALEWMHRLCYRDQPADEFHTATLFAAAGRQTAVTLDPPFLGGDRLEIDPATASLTGLTIATGRDDLLAAVLAAMRVGHRRAMAALDREHEHWSRIVLTGGGAEVMAKLLPEYAHTKVRRMEEGSLRGVARLFDPDTVA
jgi:xylulokinase